MPEQEEPLPSIIEIRCTSCFQVIASGEVSACEIDEEGAVLEAICVSCRPPGAESDEMDDEDGYSEFTQDEDKYDDSGFTGGTHRK